MAVAGNKTYSFKAELLKHPKLNAAYIEFPYDVEQEFGVKGQVKVVADIEGVSYQSSLAKMGQPRHCLGITQAIRKQINKQPGDQIKVKIKQDLALRTVEVPEMIQDMLQQHPNCLAFFNGLSYTHRKEYVVWITGAKKATTQSRRLQLMLDKLKVGIKHP